MPCFKHEPSEEPVSGARNSLVFLDRRTKSDTQLIRAYRWVTRSDDEACDCDGELSDSEKEFLPPNGEFQFEGKLRNKLDDFAPTGVCREDDEGGRAVLFSRLITLKHLAGETPAKKIIDVDEPYVCEDPG